MRKGENNPGRSQVFLNDTLFLPHFAADSPSTLFVRSISRGRAMSTILHSCGDALTSVPTQRWVLGLEVDERPVPWDEVGSFDEVAACGTAVVLTPIQSITRGAETVRFASFETISKLYDAVTSIQVGAAPDPHGYTRIVPSSTRRVLSGP